MADIRVRVGQQNAIKVVSSLSGAGGAGSLSGLNDVSINNPQTGMIMVYNASTNKWEGTMELTPGTTQNLDINGGNF